LGAPPYAAMLVSIFLASVCVWLRAYLLKGMIQFPVKPYFSMALKVLVVTITMFVVINWGIRGRVIDLFTFITFSIIIEIVLIGLYALIIGKSDRHLIYNTIKKKIGGSIYKSN
jgi:hypothetical protein